ncbi:acyloxyacyl hydrolase [Luteimonas sp. A277]
MHRLIRPAFALMLLASAPLALAQVEVGAAVSITRDSETTAIGAVAWQPYWRDAWNGQLRWDIGAMYVHGRKDTHLDLDENVVVAHGGLRWEHTSGFTAGFGAGLQVGRTDALSGNPQFVSTVGWRWDRFALLARHISNASIKQPNDGETMLMATWRF